VLEFRLQTETGDTVEISSKGRDPCIMVPAGNVMEWSLGLHSEKTNLGKKSEKDQKKKKTPAQYPEKAVRKSCPEEGGKGCSVCGGKGETARKNIPLSGDAQE